MSESSFSDAGQKAEEVMEEILEGDYVVWNLQVKGDEDIGLLSLDVSDEDLGPVIRYVIDTGGELEGVDVDSGSSQRASFKFSTF